MSETASADSSFLTKHKEKLDTIFQMYLDDITPLILQYETLAGEFPIAVLNEIRAAFGHLARASIAVDKDTQERNVHKIESHMKRALLDCHKYCCTAIFDEYDKFFKQYEGVDLSYLENGTFLPKVHALHSQARELLIKARQMELSNISEQELYVAFQDAYNQCGELYEVLKQVSVAAEYIKHKATRKERLSMFFGLVGVAGFLATIIGLFT